MKKIRLPIRLFVSTILLSFFGACNLDLVPFNIIQDKDVFKDEALIESYIGSLYNEIPFEGLGGGTPGIQIMSSLTDEAIGGIGNAPQWWEYSDIRHVNSLITKLPNSEIIDEEKNNFLGEAYFIRAFYYFSMVKRYGGVPIVKDIIDYKLGEDPSKFQQPRNTEKEVYDFIASDLDKAISLLPESNIKGRASKYAALALKSRAMLYAASAAEYAPTQLNGLLGIPSSDAKHYWEIAYNAAERIIQSKEYSLYEGTDKRKNFQNLFIDVPNSETIFVKYFSYPKKTHNYDRNIIPFGVRGPDGYGSGQNPTIRMIEQFDRIDGSSGNLKIGTPSSPIFYKKATDLFADYDPRLWATVIYPFSKWKDHTIHVQAGLYDQGKKITAGSPNTLYNPQTHSVDDNGTIQIVGLSGYGGSEVTQSGFYTRKYLDPSLAQSNVRTDGSSQPFIVFRYGEVLLNYAEAAIELDKVEDAKNKINMIRERAGIKLLSSSEVNIESVRHERIVELAFESQRWWDYKRWRISDKIFQNFQEYRIEPYYDIQHDAYRFEVHEIPKAFKNFISRQYYLNIPSDILNKNKELVQNPGW